MHYPSFSSVCISVGRIHLGYTLLHDGEDDASRKGRLRVTRGGGRDATARSQMAWADAFRAQCKVIPYSGWDERDDEERGDELNVWLVCTRYTRNLPYMVYWSSWMTGPKL